MTAGICTGVTGSRANRNFDLLDDLPHAALFDLDLVRNSLADPAGCLIRHFLLNVHAVGFRLGVRNLLANHTSLLFTDLFLHVAGVSFTLGERHLLAVIHDFVFVTSLSAIAADFLGLGTILAHFAGSCAGHLDALLAGNPNLLGLELGRLRAIAFFDAAGITRIALLLHHALHAAFELAPQTGFDLNALGLPVAVVDGFGLEVRFSFGDPMLFHDGFVLNDRNFHTVSFPDGFALVDRLVASDVTGPGFGNRNTLPALVRFRNLNRFVAGHLSSALLGNRDTLVGGVLLSDLHVLVAGLLFGVPLGDTLRHFNFLVTGSCGLGVNGSASTVGAARTRLVGLSFFGPDNGEGRHHGHDARE